MPDKDAEARAALAEKYPVEDGPYRVKDSTGHEVTVAVVRPGQTVLKEDALDENGRYRQPVIAEKPAAKTAAKEA